ncbi:GtrA family protein [Paenibacillus sp. 1011MAR3C5]|uniref:GtrA family protein n=1 Tax=Paenibacillus sp. 1011MAR3C5 TaxID=1675787 RepID=UPI000E6C654C|nr:GtrA family protein [Paenibacillus sp. 1011MAR3C5]RJE84668.1 GtrA family protein [Paenibacillus sp. 1011MAR3C5]
MSDQAGNRSIKQFLTFSVIGGLNTIIDMAVFTLLIVVHTHYSIAQIAAYAAGMLNSYIMNSVFTFRSETAGSGKRGGATRMLRFMLWNLFMLGVSLLLLVIATEWAGLHELVGKAIVTVLVVALNFYGSKRWVFAGRKPVETGGMS